MILTILVVLLLNVFLSIIVNGLLLKFSRNLGIRSHQEFTIRWSAQAKPSIGGISFFIGFLVSFITLLLVFEYRELASQNIKIIGFFAAIMVATLVGFMDDTFNTKPLIKLSGQILAGFIIAITGTTIPFSNIAAVDVAITIVWVVALMNSLNMLDNMDGITTTVSIFILIAASAGLYIVSDNDWSFDLKMNVAIVGTLIGFLYYNWHPSKMFMGDTGSQFIGLYLAYTSIDSLWRVGTSFENHRWLGFIICLVAFTPAAIDTLTVIINRLKRGQSPMVGGKDHTTHHLVYKGLKDNQVGRVFALLGLISTSIAILFVYLVSINVIWPLPLGLLYFLAVFIWIYRITLKYNAPKGTTDSNK
jgi:UDP-GlcNAc:undecaprenyl-phosphate/decaprenyl-phosphate GlcNAc-1-phosphate transferase